MGGRYMTPTGATVTLVRRFYNPDLSDAEAEGLDWDNYVTLSAVQALLGVVPAEVTGVCVEVGSDEVTLHFVVSTPDVGAVPEWANEAAFELDVLLDGQTRIRAVLHKSLPTDWTGRGWRGLYIRATQDGAS